MIAIEGVALLAFAPDVSLIKKKRRQKVQSLSDGLQAGGDQAA
jgi:hypothetical protein